MSTNNESSGTQPLQSLEKIGGKSLDGWQSFISSSLKKTVEATLDSAARIAKYRASGVSDDVFKETMKIWFGFTASHISYWSKINDSMPRFKDDMAILPASPRSLYELSAFDDDVWAELKAAGQIKPSLTVEGIKELRASGGLLKKYLAKYADSPDYLEICRHADTLKATGLVGQPLVDALHTWCKEFKPEMPAKLKPKAAPVKAEPEPPIDEDDFEDDEGLGNEVVYNTPPKAIKGELVQVPNKLEAFRMFGIYINKPLDNMAVERALEAQAGDDTLLLQALEVIRG